MDRDIKFVLRPLGYHMLNFIEIDLQLYKILKITRVSFFGGRSVYVYVYVWALLCARLVS